MSSYNKLTKMDLIPVYNLFKDDMLEKQEGSALKKDELIKILTDHIEITKSSLDELLTFKKKKKTGLVKISLSSMLYANIEPQQYKNELENVNEEFIDPDKFFNLIENSVLDFIRTIDLTSIDSLDAIKREVLKKSNTKTLPYILIKYHNDIKKINKININNAGYEAQFYKIIMFYFLKENHKYLDKTRKEFNNYIIKSINKKHNNYEDKADDTEPEIESESESECE